MASAEREFACRKLEVKECTERSTFFNDGIRGSQVTVV